MATTTLTIRIGDKLKRDAAEEPNAESCEAIAEGDAYLASDKPGRFADARNLIEAAMA